MFAQAYALGGINDEAILNNRHPHYPHQKTNTGECCPSSSSAQSVHDQDEGKKLFLMKDRLCGDGLTGVEALHPQRQPRLGDGDELQGDVELTPPKMPQPRGSAKLCDLTQQKNKEKQTGNMIFLSKLQRRGCL